VTETQVTILVTAGAGALAAFGGLLAAVAAYFRSRANHNDTITLMLKMEEHERKAVKGRQDLRTGLVEAAAHAANAATNAAAVADDVKVIKKQTNGDLEKAVTAAVVKALQDHHRQHPGPPTTSPNQ